MYLKDEVKHLGISKIKVLFAFCATCCFIALFKLPIGYYTFLRVIISLGALLALYNFLRVKDYLWLIIFVIILILFNPISPIYLYRKAIWMPLDAIVGILFLFITFLNKRQLIKEPKMESIPKEKTYARDRIIISKNQIKK